MGGECAFICRHVCNDIFYKVKRSYWKKKTLIFISFLYAISAILSAMATSYEMLYVARIIGGIAFGAALVLAPMYIAEISTAENRGKHVSLQQLNIVFGFFVMIKIVPETKGKSLEELE
jgi:MFS family permease